MNSYVILVCHKYYRNVSKHSVVRTSHNRTDPSDDAVTMLELSLVNRAELTNDVWPLQRESINQ